ncbi:PDS5A [Cordylochernes scorpioides]|uniref:PDS5A n=1 Tax=Cordylochernes scorpioides TaxID=51811 RepID=A0ABY6KX28_9ARAC|nr:PDS5A [Cordylochernes scorpioides]
MMSPPSQHKIIYPPGVKELNEDLSNDELVRRLKRCPLAAKARVSAQECAQAFQNLSQEEDNSFIVPLSLYLATPFFLEHPNKDVRLLVACCIADIFRVFAPEAPYKDVDILKSIFLFFVEQLQGLEDPKSPIFKRYFYLLENLSWVKSFNLCLELEENQQIFCQLFNLIFGIISDDHASKVKAFMLDLLSPLIAEADVISQELLDLVLIQIIEPRKTQNKHAYILARDLIKRGASNLEPYIQAFFSNILILNKGTISPLTPRVYDLVYELNFLCPTIMSTVLPQLEFKLKSNQEKERLDVTKLLARMFSDKDSDLATQNNLLWKCFLGRFNDIGVRVRTRCVQYSMHFLLNHPELRGDIIDQLRLRQHDPEENVRYEVVMAIISAAKKDFSAVNDVLLNFVKERTLDKKFKIRKEALLGLAYLYKQHAESKDLPESTRDCISWIKDKILHVYYQTALEDRMLVERILHTCLIPHQSPLEERMQKLYHLFATVDDNAVKAFIELLKSQNMVRSQFRAIVEYLQQPRTEERSKNINLKIHLLSKNLAQNLRTAEYTRRFVSSLDQNARLLSHMEVVVMGAASCGEIERSVKELLKTLGLPVQTNTYYMTLKQLFERMAPAMMDEAGIRLLLTLVRDSLLGSGDMDVRLGLYHTPSYLRGLQLIHVLSTIYPETFRGEEVYNELVNFLKCSDETAADLTIQILTSVGSVVEKSHPNLLMRLLPILQNFVENGTTKQAKHSVACLNAVAPNKERMFGQVLDVSSSHISTKIEFKKYWLILDCNKIYYLLIQYFNGPIVHLLQALEAAPPPGQPVLRTAVVSIGHIAYHCPELFGSTIKSIVSKVIVKDLLMADQDSPRESESMWGPADMLPEETRVKIQGIKLMARWLLGQKTATNSALSTLRLLCTILRHHGDLMERGHVSEMEKSWLRLTAALTMLKICQDPGYADIISPDQFQQLAQVLNLGLRTFEVWVAITAPGMYQLGLGGILQMSATRCGRSSGPSSTNTWCLSACPLEFMAILALGALEKARDLKGQLKHYLLANINRRKDFIKQHTAPLTQAAKLYNTLPDYVVPYMIHLLAHHPSLRQHDDVEPLMKLKDCLWFILEPLITKNDNYSFSFFKKLIENIKQSKDRQNPDDVVANNKLYAVCDLALGLILSKTTNFVYKDFPVEPVVPTKLFTEPDKVRPKSVLNNKSYLPPELISTLPKKSRLEVEMYLNSKAAAAASSATSTNTTTQENGDHPSPPSRGAATTVKLREMMEIRERTQQPSTSTAAPPAKKPRLATTAPAPPQQQQPEEESRPELPTVSIVACGVFGEVSLGDTWWRETNDATWGETEEIFMEKEKKDVVGLGTWKYCSIAAGHHS